MKKLISILLFFLFFAAQGKEIVVPAGGSISQAVAGASSGDVVRLSEGVYNVRSGGDISTLKTGVSLIGAGVGKSIVRTTIPTGTYPNIHDESRKAVFIISGSNISVQGLTIDGMSRTGYGGFAILKSNNIRIVNVEVKNTKGIGIYMSRVNGLLVKNYKSTDSGSTGSEFSWGAISFYHLSNALFDGLQMIERKSYAVKSQGTTISNVVFNDCDIRNMGTAGPWNGTSPNFSIEIHTSIIKDSLVVRNSTLQGLLSLATNHKIPQSNGRFIVDGNYFIPHKSDYPYYAVEMNHGPCVVKNNYAEGFERFIGEWTKGSEIGGTTLKNWVIINNVAANFVARANLSNPNARDGFGLIVTSANLENAVISNNTIYHDGPTRFILLYTSGHATGTSRNILIEKNIIHLGRTRADDYLIKRLRGGASSITVKENVIYGMRQTGKYSPNGTGVSSSNNIYASAQIQGFGDKPFPYYTSPLPHGAKPFEISVPDIPDVPTPGPDPGPVKESLAEGEIVIDAGGSDDKYYTGGTAYTGRGYNERYGEFQYNIPVSKAGRYRVSMDLTEIYHSSSGKRSFNVYAQEEVKLEGVDPWKLSNGEKLVLSFETEVPGSVLNLRFESVKDMAKVNSIGITYLSGEVAPEWFYFEKPIVEMKDTLLPVQIPSIRYVRDSVRTN